MGEGPALNQLSSGNQLEAQREAHRETQRETRLETQIARQAGG